MDISANIDRKWLTCKASARILQNGNGIKNIELTVTWLMIHGTDGSEEKLSGFVKPSAINGKPFR